MVDQIVLQLHEKFQWQNDLKCDAERETWDVVAGREAASMKQSEKSSKLSQPKLNQILYLGYESDEIPIVSTI